jgi:hypothetical protein
METQGNRLKKVRQYLDLSQKDMADKLGKVSATWSAYEVGKLPIPADVYMELEKQGFNIEWLKTGKGEMLSGTSVVRRVPSAGAVPFYELDVTAHIVKAFDDFLQNEPTHWLAVPSFSGCVAFPVYGDSMAPKISNGDIIFVKLLQSFDVILWGEIYLVVTDDSAGALRTVKKLYKATDDRCLILRSINPDYTGDTLIKKENVLTLAHVRGCIKRF